jgi:hypothetical protein
VRRRVAVVWLAAACILAVSCGGSEKRVAGKAPPPPRAALVLPSGSADPAGDPYFRGLYAEAERRGARLETGGAVYDFGLSALLRAERPLPGGADSAQAMSEFVAWGAGLVMMGGAEFAAAAADAAREAPGTRFIVIDSRPPEESSGLPPNLSFARFAVEEAAFVSGALSGCLLGKGERAGFIGMAEDPEARTLGDAFACGFAFALGEEAPSFDLRLVKEGKPWNESLTRLMGKGMGAVMASRGPFLDDAAALAASRGILMALADPEPGRRAVQEPIARALKRRDAAVSFILGKYLDGGAGFALPAGLGLPEGCVGMDPGAGYEGIAAPHASVLARAAETARAAPWAARKPE